MISSKVKTLVIVFALLVVTSIVAVGCKQRPASGGLMNTESLPGKTLTVGASKKNTARRNTNIVYLGSESNSQRDGFGPRDVSFEFQALR